MLQEQEGPAREQAGPAREGLWSKQTKPGAMYQARAVAHVVGLQPTVIASRAPHLLLEQRIVDVHRPSTAHDTFDRN